MRINHVIKTDQWRATPQIRILSSPGTNITVRSVNVVITVIVWRQTHTIEIVCSDDVTSRIMENQYFVVVVISSLSAATASPTNATLLLLTTGFQLTACVMRTLHIKPGHDWKYIMCNVKRKQLGRNDTATRLRVGILSNYDLSGSNTRFAVSWPRCQTSLAPRQGGREQYLLSVLPSDFVFPTPNNNNNNNNNNNCTATRQLHLRDGTVHRHGSRDAPCRGSNTLPLSITAQRGKFGFISDQPAPSAQADKTTPGGSGPSSQLSDRPIWTPPDHALIKHIPKSALPACASHLASLLRSIVQDPVPVTKWPDLFNWGRSRSEVDGKMLILILILIMAFSRLLILNNQSAILQLPITGVRSQLHPF